MEEMVRSYFQPLYVRVDNNTNDQDYIPEGGDIDGRDRSAWHELERVSSKSWLAAIIAIYPPKNNGAPS